jgi:hypothetical protein
MKKILIAPLLILLLAGCYPQGPDYAEDTDVVYTTFDEGYDFKTKSTYAMPDKIVTDVKIELGDTTYVYMNDKFADQIFESIEENMQTNGYERVDIDEDPDLLLTPAAISSTTYFYSYWYDWWYGGYWGWGWGWYYPPYYTVSSYTTGTMLMVIADPNQAAESPINRSKTLWVAAINGLANYNYNISRVTKGIDQAFDQSGYLKSN